MQEHHDNNETKTNEKWDFADYAYTITAIIVVTLLVVPDMLYSMFELHFLGGSLGNVASSITEGLEYGPIGWSITQLRVLSPLLFLATTSIVMFKEAFDARKNGGYTGSMFTHTFESLFEEAIYMTITTIMVFGAALAGAMYASWLAGPITWILFIFIFPLVRKKTSTDDDAHHFPWLLLFIFIVGLFAEALTRAWVAFPLSWLVICAIELVRTVREKNYTIDTVFNIIYYVFSVILMTVGISFNFWIASWSAFPIALFICWIASKFKRFKKAE
ncbi:MAG: hypothetical protein FWC92_11805 [Defluviitaleaceae bacterium]|nr:hypothetical protein [Defluviitaleaceae bacterium]